MTADAPAPVLNAPALLIDTAGPLIGVVSRAANGVLNVEIQRIVAGADGWLTPALGRALAHIASPTFTLGVVTGPGAFTGIRVGIAHALGLAVARKLSVVPVSSLAVRACFATRHGHVLSVLDGKKGRVYAQRFDTRGPWPVALGEPVDVDPAALAPGPGLAVGEGAVVYAATLTALGYTIVDQPDQLPLAAALGLLDPTAAVLPEQLRPMYLREPDAVPPPGVTA